MSLSDNLRNLRISLGLTQEQISKDLNINRGTYAHYETARREPDLGTLKSLAKYFNVSLDELLDNNISSCHDVTFGQRLKGLREKKQITQNQLAKNLGVGRATIAAYETKGKQPSFEILENIANFFDTSIDYLLGRIDIVSPLNLVDAQPNNSVSKDIQSLSPESQEEIKKLIELYKIRDMQNRNLEIADELTSTE